MWTLFRKFNSVINDDKKNADLKYAQETSFVYHTI